MEAALPDLAIGVWVLAGLAFLAGGIVKGVLGVGLPLFTVPVLAGLFEPATAIALMVVPILSSNAWQALQGGLIGEVLRRFWSAMPGLIVLSVIGAQFISKVEPSAGSLVMGLIVIAFVIYQLRPLGAATPLRAERWLTPLVGVLSGGLGGVSHFYGPPLIAYLVALRLPKDMFVATVATWFVIGNIPLYGSLALSRVLDLQVLVASSLASGPALLGLVIGRRLRRHVSQDTFHKLLLLALLVVAGNLIRVGVS
ncbi:MAG: sulfite exporter TauE/SafE family protein [Alphaproteobacteria bacterium]